MGAPRVAPADAQVSGRRPMMVSSAAVLAAAAACLQAAGRGSPSFVQAPVLDTVGSLARGCGLRGGSAPRAGAQQAAAGGSSAFLGVGAVAALAAGAAVRRRAPRTTMRAVTEVGSVKLNLPAGKATPAPPVGPALGQFGANIAFFVKEYNALTADKVGNIIPVIVHVMSDRSFTLELKTPPTAALIHKAAGQEKGSGKAGIDIIGTISIDQLREIAELKLNDLNCDDVSRAMKIVHGTCVASGVEVEGYEEWLKTIFPKPETIMGRYGPGKQNLPEPWNES